MEADVTDGVEADATDGVEADATDGVEADAPEFLGGVEADAVVCGERPRASANKGRKPSSAKSGRARLRSKFRV